MVAAASVGRNRARQLGPHLLVVTVLASVVAGCGWLPGPSPVAGWIWPTPFPRPADAVAVPIELETIQDIPPGAAYGCPMALLGPVVPAHHPDDPERPVRYRLAAGGEEVRVIWQQGFQAWLRPGLEIVAPDGRVVAREGLASEPLGGGAGAVEGGEEILHVCFPEYAPREVRS